ncbi:peptidylprolyl isomerase [Chamaesiphon polymorphus]|nr:peptidylprolyl isomerase [Chamaesiphon polymorphus]
MLTNESESNFINTLSPSDDRPPDLTPTSEKRILNLDLGHDRISSDLVVEQLAEYRLLSQQVEEIILDKLLTQAAIDLNIHIDYSSAEFEERYTLNRQSRSYRGMNSAQLTAISERELKLQKFKELRWGDRVAAYFQTHQPQLDRVTISTIEVDDSFIANELFFRINADEQSFAEIALEYSQDAYRQTGGTIGPVFFRELSPKIGGVVRKLQPGELSIPLLMGGKYRLIRLDRLEPAQLNAQMHKLLLDELFTTWFKAEMAVDDNLGLDLAPDLIVNCLSRSKLLIPYLRSTIVRETLTKWQQSAEYQLLLASAPPIESDLDSSQSIAEPLPRSVILQQYQQAQWGHLLNSRFLQSKSQLDRVLFSAIQVKDFHLAVELSARVGEREQSLTKLAIDYSQHPTAKMGGTVGPIQLAQLHPLIYRHLIALKPKQLSPIFQLDGNYVFLRLECWLPVKFDRQIQQHFLNEFFEQWLEQQVAERIGLIVLA